MFVEAYGINVKENLVQNLKNSLSLLEGNARSDEQNEGFVQFLRQLCVDINFRITKN